MEIISNKYFLIAITFATFWLSKFLQRRTGMVLMNPVLLTVAALIALLQLTDISYETYSQGGDYISFWLQPAVVALGVPLYQQLRLIRRQLLPILLSQLAGCVVGLLSVVLVSQWMGAPREVVLSLAPKSVTTPIAMEVSSTLGGIPSLTAAVVVMTGLLGAVFGFTVLRRGRVRSTIAQGLSIGTASHAVGTGAAMEFHRKCGAYAGLGLTLNGIFTALLTPFLLELIM